MSELFDGTKLGDAEAIRRAGQAANQFNAAKDNIIDSGKVAAVKVRRESASTARRLSEFTGFSFYTLGPVYTVARIGFDIVGDYGNHTGFVGPRVIINLRAPFFDGLGAWNTVLEGIPTEHMIGLRRFMASQTALMVDTGIYWRFEEETITCPDPLGVDRLDIQGPADTAEITVFVPSGNRARYTIKQPAVPPLQFTAAQPRTAVVVEARAAIQAHKNKGISAA